MRRDEDPATVIEAGAERLATVLDPARGGHTLPVSPTQLRVLRWLRANPATTVNGLADMLAVGASSASRLCDRLEALGFLRRTTDPRDRREVQLVVTSAANALLDTINKRRRLHLEQVLASMSPSARRDLARSLSAFAVAAASLAAEPGGRAARRRTA